MLYEFTDALKTGNQTIDDEHKFLIKTANDTLEQIKNGASKEQVLRAVKILANYVMSHFAHEEDLQRQYQYPHIRSHSLWHMSYMNDIDVTCNRVITEGVSDITAVELKRRIETLIKHILNDDTKLAKFIQENSIERGVQ